MVKKTLNRLSVVLATHNEAKNLPRCLDSVKDLANEIIVVDGQSTDDTVKIARKYQAKIIKTTNKLNFHLNKQMGLDAAKGELVLQLDADEVVDQALARFIFELKQARWVRERKTQNAKGKVQRSKLKTQSAKSSSQPVAWWIRRKNLFLNTWLKKGGQYPDPVIRLYINGFAWLPTKSVHEQMAVAGKVGWAKGHLLHYSNPTFADYLRKFNTYTSFTADAWYKQGLRPSFSLGFKNYFFYPIKTFFSLFIRHKGFLDKQAGFIFALMSGLHWPFAYLKLWEIYEKNQG